MCSGEDDIQHIHIDGYTVSILIIENAHEKIKNYFVLYYICTIFGSGVKKAKERSAKITRKKAGKSVKSKEKKRNVPQIEGFSGKKRQKVNERIFANFARFDTVTCKNEKGG